MSMRGFLRSSIGAKMIMALTGLGLSGFVLIHMLGNWLIYLGPDAINAYGATMQANKPLLWTARSGLLLIFIVHIILAIKLSLANRAARPVAYSKYATIKASFASRTMLYTGLLILIFTLYHLAHFTLHYVNDVGQRQDALGRHDVYFMVVTGFQNPLIVTFYVTAMLMLGLHLSHGVSSLFQSLGLNRPTMQCTLKKIGIGFAILITLGNISMPLSVLLGFIKLPVGG